MIKRLILAAVVSAIYGCVFIPIPVSMLAGTHCVRPDAKVGDVVTDIKTKVRYVITEINPGEEGQPYYGCSTNLPQRAKVKAIE